MTPLLTTPADTTLVLPGAVHELIRGQENELLEHVAPMVCDQNVSLDFSFVERIDAAGIAALIMLYRCAQNTGHHFSVANASHRVSAILALVGLDHILLAPEATALRSERTAA